VRVRFHIEAHEYNGRWFNEIRLDAVTFVGASASKNQQPAAQPEAQAAQTAAVDNQQANQPAEAQKAADGEQKDKDDDLPF
jgi:single-stranded DNA-binding protein